MLGYQKHSLTNYHFTFYIRVAYKKRAALIFLFSKKREKNCCKVLCCPTML